MTTAPELTLSAHAMPSVNRLAGPLVRDIIARASSLRLHISQDESGVTLVDAGIACEGGVEAGLAIAEICMAGLGRVQLSAHPREGWPRWVEVSSSQPVLACLGSQYAGWSLSASKEETQGKSFFALGSGPARALAVKEELYGELGYRDTAGEGVLVLEADRLPPRPVLNKVLNDCGLTARNLTVIVTPTRSSAGTTQVVARVLEVALHKAHEIGFDLRYIVDGSACAPLPAPADDGLEAMGRTNDAILYGGSVHLSVRGSDEEAERLARELPSGTSRDYGKSFKALFEAAGYDFYKLDGALFAPAEVWVSNLDTGRTWHRGATDLGFLRGLWVTE
ncbi:methenyltetrahydromethanopterin cyclohydrolase [Xanthobacter sp. TB0139]|uniref:methenyltetrahydromethanopterin cyclohydrolase n=1 Tax=Xanthobacter sp. TB0139 TaxID=3459178 RepID=UPI004039950F